jgi:CPA2 family monovalent cation:H+ antiporter-2
MTPTLAVLVETPGFFAEVAALLVAGAAIAYASFRLGLVPIVGFLLAGVLIGPNGIGLVRDPAIVNAAAELGVILLLFTIGIEFSFEKLGRIRRLIFVGGGLQVVLAVLVTLGVLAALGIGWRIGLYTGFLVALSSTAIVLKLLADRSETTDPHGQVALGLLIFQDLAVVAMVLVVPMMGGAGGSIAGVLWALAKAGLIIAAVLLFARRLMPIVLEAVARTCSPELFLLTVIAICFGTAYATSLAGVSLSLGAFLAGLLVSESQFSEHALGEILPLQILFSATFFVSVGMLFDIRFLLEHLPLVVAGTLAVIAIKVVTTGASVLALGYRVPVVAASGLLLAQVGEFSFVLERVGRDVGLFPAGIAEAGSQAFIAVTVLLMVLTPALAAGGRRLATRFERKQAAETARSMEAEAEATPGPSFEHLENHVVVAGYGTAATKLVRALQGTGIPFVITTLSPAGAREAESQGLPVLRGDSSRLRTLQMTGTERAKLLVIADDDPAMAERIAAVARTANPTMRIVVRTRYEAEIEPLLKVGTDRVISEELESIVQLFAEVLRTYEIAPAEIEAREEALRVGAYRGLLIEQPEMPARPCELGEDCLHTRNVMIRDGAFAAGKTLGELDLIHRYGIMADEIRRNGSVEPPSPDRILLPGDELVLRGSSDAFVESAGLFRQISGAEDAENRVQRVTATTAGGIDTERRIELRPDPAAQCSHKDGIRAVHPSARGCEDCLRIGSPWVHLRICMTCGHVGCCDSSPNRHATAHFHATSHPIIRSLQPGEDWGWCYVDQIML